MVTEAAGAGQFDLPGFGPVPRIQIVTIEQAMALRDRAVRLPAAMTGSKRRRERKIPRRKGGWIFNGHSLRMQACRASRPNQPQGRCTGVAPCQFRPKPLYLGQPRNLR